MENKFACIISPDTPWDDKKDLITMALESGIDTILDTNNELDKINKLANLTTIANNKNADIFLVGINGEGDNTQDLPNKIQKSNDLKIAKKHKNNGETVAAFVIITDKKHEQLASELGKVVDYLILLSEDWTVIPLENIIAGLQSEDVKIVAAVSTVEEAKVALETLEVGTDGVIFEPKNFQQIKEMANLIENISHESYQLKEATITNIKPLGTGDRVCIDTTSMMVPGEGMLIGSYSKAMFLVHSESLESEYVASRPFRVNAGPVQAYIMVPGNKTRYLSELEAGDSVLVVDKNGKTRESIVGRCKIEKRPLILLEAEYEDIKIKSLLQNAETIRVVSSQGEAVSVSDLQPGDKVKVFIDDSARHFGMAIDETIIEK